MDQVASRAPRILVAEESDDSRRQAVTALENFFPTVQLQEAETWEISQSSLSREEFDIVIIDLDLAHEKPLLDLIFTLKTFDYEPSVIVIAERPFAHVLNELYRFGCHRCIVKDERWIEELGTAVDYLIRIRKVAHENHVLRAKLTEANMLLEEKNARLDEFSATVAHDIRGPLGGLAMKLEYLLEKMSGEFDQERMQHLMATALGSTERLISLVQTMYEYAKLGSKASEMKRVSLDQVVTDAIHDLALPEELDVEVHLGELPSVWGNAPLLQRVFMNLISNAVKYSDKEQIVLHIQTEGIQKKMVASFVEVSFRDNGPGIPADEQDDIFSLFKRGSVGRKQASDGTGVGLAIVKRIIELHYGAISLSSSTGEGSSFLFTLPLESPTAIST
ncbi:ATP-binding protein [bacterium]|nr:ATP-binding protein [bacterium]